MDLLDLIIEYHKDAKRLGPGSDEATKKTLSFIPQLNENSQILDVGCGTGAQTMVLAQSAKANLIAVDMLPQFLERLDEEIENNDLSNRVVTKKMTMESLNFEEKSFDVIWSEGAIYNIGFEKGLTQWRKYLKDKRYIVVSEILTGLAEKLYELC